MSDARPRRHVSDEEFNRAWFGDPDDPESLKAAKDNRAVAYSAFKRCRHITGPERRSCAMLAVWKTLQYHEPGRQKFTSSLYRFAGWVRNHELRSISRQRRKWSRMRNLERVLGAGVILASLQERKDQFDELLSFVPSPEDQLVLTQYFKLGYSTKRIGATNGYCKETARQRLSEAMEAARQALSGVRL